MEKGREILLKAGAAFGSGAHETTQLSLAALSLLADENFDPENILDVGCGSGILSLAAAHHWPEATLLASDIAPEAVSTAAENFTANNLQARASAIRSDGYSKTEITTGAPYQLIICNILAEPILRMAPELAKHLAPGGKAILSGILVWLMEPVLEAHRTLGLQVCHTLSLKDWRSVVLEKSEH